MSNIWNVVSNISESFKDEKDKTEDIKTQIVDKKRCIRQPFL